MTLSRIAPLLVFATISFSQSSESLRFETAAVRVAAPLGPNEFNGTRTGGPGTNSPQLMSWRRNRMIDLLQQAYGVRPIQVVGPSWMTQPRDELYDINVSIREGATKDDFKMMLRNLLADRFGLQLHRESKEFDGFALVESRSGAKLAKFLTKYPNGSTMRYMRPIETGSELGVGNATTLDLAELVEAFEFKTQPVIDKTGLAGRYDFTVQYSGLDSAAGSELPSLPTALEEVLGLSLQKSRVTLEMLIVDHLERMPTEN